MATYTWTGGGADNKWSTAGNWSGGVAPPVDSSAHTLVFAGTAQLANVNDRVTHVQGLEFALGAGSFSITGTSFKLGNGGITNKSGKSQEINNNIELSGAQTWVLTSGNLVLWGEISSQSSFAGTVILTKTGTGQLHLHRRNPVAPPNRYFGDTAINEGIVGIHFDSAFGNAANSLIFNGGTLLTWDFATHTRKIILGAGGGTLQGTFTQSGVISGSGKLTTKGNITLTAVNTYSGDTVLTGFGTLVVKSPNGLGASPNVMIEGTLKIDDIDLASNATFTLNAWTSAIALVGSGTASVHGKVILGGNGPIRVDPNGVFTLSGLIEGNGFKKEGDGTLILTHANTYTGGTAVNAGTLRASHENALGTALNGTTVAKGATLEIANKAIGAEAVTLNGGTLKGTGTAASLAGNVTLAASTPAGTTSIVRADNVNNLDGTVTLSSLTLSGVISDGTNTFPLIKAGNGTVILANANTYNGTTTVQAGTLSILGSTATAGTGLIDVLAGASLVPNLVATIANIVHNDGLVDLLPGGTKPMSMVDFTRDVSGAGNYTSNIRFAGRYSPGNGNIGAITTFGGDLLFTPTGSLDIKLGGTSPGQYDQVRVTGVASLAGILRVTLVPGFVPTLGAVFTIITYASAAGAGFATIELPYVSSTTAFIVEYKATSVVLTLVNWPPNTLPAPAGYWNFNSLVNGALPDMSGNGADGQLMGEVSLSTGLFGSAGEFHGRSGEGASGNDAVEISSANRPQLHFQAQVSAAAWVYPTADSQFRSIVNQWYAMDSFQLGIVNGNYFFSVAVPDPNETWGKHYMVETPVTLNSWAHVAGVYDGSVIKIYVNGVLRASIPASGTLQQSTRPITIGNHPSPNGFKGKIDEVRLYQQALTDAQVAFLASSTP